MVAAFRPLPWKDFRIFADETAFPEDRYAGARMRVTALGCNETVMGKMYRCLLLLTLAFFTFACEKGDDAPAPTPTPDVDRTVLVYLASDNNLYRFALQNLNDMKSAMEGLDGNLLVYIDEANGTSRLSKIESDGTERVIETYGKENSASAAVLRRVVDRVLTFYPAESYGLILWSHGMGWIPAGIEETGTSSGLCCPRDTEAYPVTKYFGADTENVVCTFPTHRAVDRVQKAVSFSGKARALEDGTAWWIIGVLPNGDYLMMYAGDEEMFVGTAPASAFSGIGQTEDDGDWDDEGWDDDWDDEEAAEWDDTLDAGIG